MVLQDIMPPLAVLIEVYHGVREALFDEYDNDPDRIPLDTDDQTCIY